MSALCQCGCGQVAPIAKRTDRNAGAIKGEPRRFIKGHNPKRTQELPNRTCDYCGAVFRPRTYKTRFCSRPCLGRGTARTGADHHNYNGGWFRSQGRLMVRTRDNKMVAWYRILMENAIGRPLSSDEVVHHINGDHTDDRLENLELLTHSEHAKRHERERTAARWPKTEMAAAG